MHRVLGDEALRPQRSDDFGFLGIEGQGHVRPVIDQESPGTTGSTNLLVQLDPRAQVDGVALFVADVVRRIGLGVRSRGGRHVMTPSLLNEARVAVATLAPHPEASDR